MNQHLQNILNIIQQDKNLSEEEKNTIKKSLKDADKEFEITSFKLDRTEKVKRTTAILLEETIEELEQKRKAVEVQNRELEIESALERVRTVAMSMSKPDDLLSICEILYNELQKSGFNELRNAMINIHNDVKGFFLNYDYASHTGKTITTIFYNSHPVVESHIRQIKSAQDAFAEIVVTGKELDDWRKFRKENGEQDDPVLDSTRSVYYYFYSVGTGDIGISTYHSIANEKLDVLKKFRNVFDLAYKRYTDITKAEAQAREAQIQLALERVRARTMAMQHSDELTEAANLLFKQVQLLNLPVISCGYNIWEKEDKICNAYMSDEAGFIQPPFKIPLTESPVFIHFAESRQKEETFYSEEVSGELLSEHYKYMLMIPSFAAVADKFRQAGFSFPEFQVNNVVNFSFGNLIFITYKPVPEGHEIFKRFGKTFEQTYTRFLDLQKAEAQTREATIEAALEKVRSRSMGMQKSEELKEVIQVVYDQFMHLNIHVEHTGFIMDHKERDDMHIWLADEHEVPAEITIPYFDSPHWNSFREAKMKGENFFANHLSFEEKNKFYEDLFKLFPVPDEAKKHYFSAAGLAISTVLLDDVGLYIENFSGVPYSDEENKTLMRFGKVFQQTYTRFNDLKQAEAQAREAQIETALERVRSRTLAMQKSDELAETSAILFKQLILLGISPNRLYISIIKDDDGETEFWITDEDGSKVSMAYEDNLNHNPSFKKMFEGWKQQKKSLVIDMQGDELEAYLAYLSSIHVPFKGARALKRRLQYIAYFSKGFIGMASPDQQPAETLQLLERFAYVLNLTFTRFNDLQIAEAHALQAEQDLIEIKTARKKAEDALSELQVTQQQLIQSEKMASLGELTAGIAHEIQNPLNFVNNFSEVSKELLDEMKAALESGNKEEANEIANDIIQNLEKINHHGKRADAIVKGMLQHSRKSSGQKEPTDINALCDEYLRLSYHGLRAKDKLFNTDFTTDFDESLGKISIVPQDIGRVLLNLFNNAFYAVNEKKKIDRENYKPLISIQTKKVNDTIEIRIEDNGNGIPQNILDKIFQPFFTTKPTGQGTGLGLSLVYDIITKEHSGTIKAESKESEGSRFIIELPQKSLV